MRNETLSSSWAGLPRPSPQQNEMDQMMRAAVELSPIVLGIPQRHNVVKLILAFYSVNGSMNFTRGWVRALMIEFTNAGISPPTRSSITWYRSRLLDNPLSFRGIPGIDLPLLNRLARC